MKVIILGLKVPPYSRLPNQIFYYLLALDISNNLSRTATFQFTSVLRYYKYRISILTNVLKTSKLLKFVKIKRVFFFKFLLEPLNDRGTVKARLVCCAIQILL